MHEDNNNDMNAAQSALLVDYARFIFKPCLTLEGIDPDREGVDELSIRIMYRANGWIEVSAVTETRRHRFLTSNEGMSSRYDIGGRGGDVYVSRNEGETIEDFAYKSAIEMLERVTGSEGLGKDYSVYSIFITRD